MRISNVFDLLERKLVCGNATGGIGTLSGEILVMLSLLELLLLCLRSVRCRFCGNRFSLSSISEVISAKFAPSAPAMYVSIKSD